MMRSFPSSEGRLFFFNGYDLILDSFASCYVQNFEVISEAKKVRGYVLNDRRF